MAYRPVEGLRSRPAIASYKDWDNTTLGTLRLNGARLVVDVNSARRRDRIAKEIAKRFGKSATLVETTVTDMMKELGGAPRPRCRTP